MRRPVWLVLLALVAGCATGGGRPPAPVTWPPGQYFLEATVSYVTRFGIQRDEHSAELHVEADQSIRLDSQTGICRDPLPLELQRDESRGVRTFRCGEVTFEIRPGPGTVTGQLSITVRELYRIRVCQERAFANPNGRCVRWDDDDRERTVTRRERLRVVRLD